MISLGREYVIVFSLSRFDNKLLSDAIESAISNSHLHPLGSNEHAFEGNGFTKLWILTESHVALSTWPERQSGVINVFVCNPSFELQEFLEGFSEIIPDANFTFAEKTFEA